MKFKGVHLVRGIGFFPFLEECMEFHCAAVCCLKHLKHIEVPKGKTLWLPTFDPEALVQRQLLYYAKIYLKGWG